MKNINKDNVLILGGTGYIGKKLSTTLVNKGFNVYVVSFSGNSLKSAHKKSDVDNTIAGTIRLIDASNKPLQEQLEYLHSLEIGFNACINLMGRSNSNIHQSNVETAAIAGEVFKKLKILWPECINYHFSSIATLKKKDLSQYADAKVAGEKIVQSSGACNYIVYHSIVDSNSEKIFQDLQKLTPIFFNSTKTLDRVELTTISIDFLTNAISNHLLTNVDFNELNKKLIILEKEMSLRTFMTMMIEAPEQEQNLDFILLSDKLKNLNIPEAVRKRAENFLLLAQIDDENERIQSNHYFNFGRLSRIQNTTNLVTNQSFQESAQQLRKDKHKEFIIPFIIN